MKVEIFSRNDPAQLQVQVNNFLKDIESKNGKVVDIKFDTAYLHDIDDLSFSAMVMYTISD
jgi:hypothetical protein